MSWTGSGARSSAGSGFAREPGLLGRFLQHRAGEIDERAPAVQAAGKKSVIVIGGGFGGMAAALRLRHKGYHVTLVDQCQRLGGRAQVFERDGFRFDAGPTVLTAPFLFEELFELFGKSLHEHVTLLPVAPWYRFHFADGSRLDYGPDDEATIRAIEALSPVDGAGYRRFGLHARAIYEVAFRALADQPFDDPWATLREAPAFLRLGAYRSVWSLVQRHLRDERLRQAFSVQPLLIGGNPMRTTSIYALIHHLERAYGVWFPKGGTGALVDALEELMRDAGIEIKLGQAVERITVENGAVTGVTLQDDGWRAAEIVVSNCDPMHLYRHMLPPESVGWLARRRLVRSRLSIGLFVLYFGTDRSWPEVAHHSILFRGDHRRLLHTMFETHAIPDDLALYLHRPAASDPGFAPADRDSFYVLCPVPNLADGEIDWTREAPRLRDRILAELESRLLPGLRASIATSFWMTPEDFAERYSSFAGAGFSIAPIFTQSAFLRFHNRGEGVKGLYLVGAGTHPGAGIPGVMMSAKVVDRLIEPAHSIAG